MVPCARTEVVPELDLPKDTKDPSWREVVDIVRKARSVSAPGPYGIPCKVYKKCIKCIRNLWKLLKVVWRNGKIPSCWQKAEGHVIPKEEISEWINYFW